MLVYNRFVASYFTRRPNRLSETAGFAKGRRFRGKRGCLAPLFACSICAVFAVVAPGFLVTAAVRRRASARACRSACPATPPWSAARGRAVPRISFLLRSQASRAEMLLMLRAADLASVALPSQVSQFGRHSPVSTAPIVAWRRSHRSDHGSRRGHHGAERHHGQFESGAPSSRRA